MESIDAQWAERRSGRDRRSGKLPNFSRFWLTGRRASVRRAEDRRKSHRLDRHSVKTFALILFIISLSILDAALTLDLIARGATELNPIMDYYLRQGPRSFFAVKYFLTCSSLLLILFNKNLYLFQGRIRMRSLFLLCAVPYAAVVQWEIYLFLSN